MNACSLSDHAVLHMVANKSIFRCCRWSRLGGRVSYSKVILLFGGDIGGVYDGGEDVGEGGRKRERANPLWQPSETIRSRREEDNDSPLASG